MKTIFLIIIGCLVMLCGTYSFAYQRWDCGDDGCYKDDNAYCKQCQCTDPGAGRNDCMSDSEYCEVFGNVGAR